MIFASDLDGVIANPYMPLEKRVIEKVGDCVPYAEWNDPAFENLIPEEHRSWVRDNFSDPAFWEQCEVFQDSLDWVNKQSEKHKIYIVTARLDSMSLVTLDWLKQEKLKYEKILHVPRGMKSEAIRSVGAEFMIEDDPRNAKAISEAGIKTYVITRPYNVDQDIGESIRIESLEEIPID